MTSDGGRKASAGKGVSRFDALKPSQAVVEIPDCEVSVTSQDGLQPTVSVVDLLRVKGGVAHPLTGCLAQHFVTYPKRRSAGRTIIPETACHPLSRHPYDLK